MNDIETGLLLGLITGLTLAVIAFLEQYPKWKKQGFSRALLPKEKQFIKNYYSENSSYNKKVKFYQKKYLPLILWVAFILILLPKGYINETTIVIGCFSTVAFFLIPFFLSAIIADPFIRKNKSSAK